MHEIMELKEMLMDELSKFGSKGDLSAGDLEVVDKLAHAIKNLCKIVEGSDKGFSRRSYYEDGGSSYRRGMSARRDSRGRYAREGGSMYYRNADEFVEQMEELMESAPNEQVKQQMRQMMQSL